MEENTERDEVYEQFMQDLQAKKKGSAGCLCGHSIYDEGCIQYGICDCREGYDISVYNDRSV